MVADFFQASYGFFSHRFYVQNPFVYVKMCFVRGHVHNNIACVNKVCTHYKRTESLCMHTKYFVCVQILCGHTRGFICVHHVSYAYQTCCTCTQLFVPNSTSIQRMPNLAKPSSVCIYINLWAVKTNIICLLLKNIVYSLSQQSTS